MDARSRYLLGRRLSVIQVLALGALGLLILFYGWLQIPRHGEFEKQALSQAVKERSLPAPRGIIYDRNGHPLVDNRKALHLVIQREDLPADPAVVADLAAALQLDPDEVARKIHTYRNAPKGRPLVLMENLDEAGIALAERVRARYPFLSVQVAPRRVYLGDGLAGHALGYVSEVDDQMMGRDPGRYQLGEIVGRAGFEASGNAKLKGVDGGKRVLVDQLGREVASLDREDPKAGRSLYLTLDAGLQKVAEEAFAQEKGAVVVLDLRDGGVLAIYSSPTYDPNLFLDRLSQEMVDRYLRNPVQPMLNRATQGIYAPGSTWKLLMALSGLEHHVITPHTVFYCGGHKSFYGHDFRCDKTHGSLDLIGAIAKSCDIYFYEVAARLDIDQIHETAEKYGLTVPTGLDLPHERAPRVPSREWKRRVKKEKWYAGETISVGIGQGAVGMTPMALARFYALLATQGKEFEPHLFHGFQDPATGARDATSTPLPKQVDTTNPDWWGVLHEGMAHVVESGTAATNPLVRQVAKEVPFSGKTGTSQVATFVDKAHYAQLAKHLKDNSLFAGYAPTDKPQIAFAVVVENAGFGSEAAAPIAAKLIQYWFVDRMKNPLPPPGGKVPDAFPVAPAAED
ncbi:MAG TPA: penicillin-binding protein 2 [Holophagaceae bacterium]|jgi:penicillin-binding protein 2|nr:penicillin-binding protein 2 [Holophagaceae bacterium]